MQDKLISITYQLLDLGKRNRLLNYRDTGLKTLAILNKNVEEIFRNIKAYRDCPIYNLDPALNQYHNEFCSNDENDNVLQYEYDKVYEIARKNLQPKELLCYKKSYSLNKVLKSLAKDYRSSIIEKGMNSLYASFGFIHYIEEEEEYTAPVLLIPIELSNEGDGYKIRQYEDDIILNPTLKYYFNNMFNIDLCDYNDEALSTYFVSLKEILPEGTYLEEAMAIGIYSFYKMNMYNDLMSNKDKVIKNDNIRILLGDDTVIQNVEQNQPIYPVVNCDSSQLGAIQMAANGKSFCLQGPPGSGKSQTITNIISSLLGAGKKILFVSEKIAALRVVFENLRRARLSEFAIELHSNKANKKEFIENLYKTATLPKYDIDLKTRFLSAKYQSITSKLANYDNQLSKPIAGIGVNLLDLYSMYIGIKVEPLDIHVKSEEYNLFDLDKIVALFNDYISYSKTCGYDYRHNPLYGLTNVNEAYILYNLNEDLKVSINHIKNLIPLVENLNNYECFNIINLEQAYSSISIIDKIVRLKSFSPLFLIKKNRIRIIDLIEKYFSLLKGTESELFDIYDKSILNENIEKLYSEYQTAMNNNKGLFKFSNKALKEINDKILLFRRAKDKPEVILDELKVLISVRRNYLAFQEIKTTISKILGEGNLNNLKAIALDLKSIDGIPDIVINKEQYLDVKRIYTSSPVNNVVIKQDSLKLISIYKNIYEKSRINIFKKPLVELLDMLNSLDSEKNHFSFYIQFIKCVDEISKFNALDFLHKYLDENLDIMLIANVYKKTFIKEKIDSYVESSEILKSFKSDLAEDEINDFRELDEKILNINRDFIISEISQKRPNETVLDGSEFKILTREYNKLRRQLPIRVLLEQTFELVLDIKPVFLMSPLSVSTYLASELNMFDCVIFDEASQIFASDALGSIYRAKQCIIIGDTKQMPPTNFFHASLDDEDIEYDLESILDKASQMFDMTSLKWHYRSRSEELITFSNGSFYDGNLITVPQSKKHEIGFGIDFYYVENGRYDTQTRTNPIEANKICDMVFEHFKTRGDKESLGVVAFSNVQAELIASLVEKRLKKFPEYQKYFDDELDEPFFVKNLETVQGDERDRIIFSICYGYNEEGKFYQRFGPLNNSGGERRLNVAITRAKYNVSVVASVKYYDIKDTTDAKGVLLLRSYLEFAENVITNKNFDSTKNSIISDVKAYIESLGYDVYPQYGTSSFKVELAVKKDDDFILAVMTDCASSYSSNLTDRYRLEKLLLERLGWRYFKLYSTAWINENEEEKERLKKALEGEDESERISLTSNDKSYLRVDSSLDSVDFSFDDYHMLDIDESKRYLKTKGIAYLINEIINYESPIHREYLYKRIALVMDKAKATSAIRDIVDDNIPEKTLKIGDYLYSKNVSDIRLRINSDRDIIYIPDEELKDGLFSIINKNNGITIDGCYRTLVQILGNEKITPNARKRLDDALSQLKFEGKIFENNGSLYRK